MRSISVSNDMNIHKDRCLHPTNVMLTTSQNKSVYTGILGVHNRKYVNKGEPVWVKNTGDFSLFSQAIKRSREANTSSLTHISTGKV